MAIQTNIYDNEIYFAITFQGQTHLIIEPDGWNRISERIPRDKKYYGFWSDFLEDKYGMRFTFIKDGDKTGGGEILKSIYETVGQGPDSEVFFEFGIKDVETLKQINSWRINLNEYDCENPGGVLTSIEKMPFQAKLRARMNAPCTINTYSNMDGGVLDEISTTTLRLHAKTLLLKSQGVSSSPQRSNPYFDNFGTGNPLVMQPDQSNLSINQLPEVFTQPMGLLNIGSVTPSSPLPVATGYPDFVTGDLCQMVARYSGQINITIQASFDWWYWHRSFEYAPAGGATGWQCFSKLVVQRTVAGVSTSIHDITGTIVPIDSTSTGHVYPAVAPSGVLPDVTGADRNNCNKTPLTWNETYSNLEIQAGDRIFVSFVLEPVGVVTDLILLEVQADNFLSSIEYSQMTTTQGTTANGYRIFDVVNQCLENITGEKDSLISDFFSQGGYGWEYILCNGYGIRNFGGVGYKFKISLESLLKSLQAIFCLGVSVKRVKIGTNKYKEYLVIDKAINYFKDRTIATFTDEVFDWKDKHGGEYCFNQIQLGYNKYEGLNINQNDEFCTQGSYLIQSLSTAENSFEMKSDMIAAGTLLEIQRRNQFVSNPDQSLTNDEDIFIVATISPCIFPAALKDATGLPWATYMDASGKIGFGFSSMALQKGDTIMASTGLNAGTLFTVIERTEGFPILNLDSYNVTPNPIAEVLNTTITITPPSPDQLFAERHQPFEICTGVPDPSTIYNGRLSLKHILYNWRDIFGIGLYFIDPASPIYRVSQIVTTLVKMNSLFTTKFLSTEANKGNIGDITTVEMNRESVRNYLSNGKSAFTPLGAECKVKIGNNQMNLIRFALAGELNDSRYDNGGLVLRDCFGVDWFCHVMDIQYDLVKEIATLQIQKVKVVTL